MKTKDKPKTKSARVGFSISGEWVTQQVRDLWLERDFARTFRVLDCMEGMTREQQESVIFGRAKLTGVNTLELEPDDWTPPGEYATFEQALGQGKDYPELQRRREEDAEDYLREAVKLSRCMDSESKSEIRSLMAKAEALMGKADALTRFQQLFDEDQEARILIANQGVFADRDLPVGWREKDQPLGPKHLRRDDYDYENIGGLEAVAARAQQALMGIAMKDAGFDPTAMPSTAAMLGRGHDAPIVKCPDMSSVNGWLARDGTFYQCLGMEHVGIACQLFPDAPDGEQAAEEAGWVKLARSFTGFHCLAKKKPSKKQLNKLWDYAQFHKRDYEELIQHLPDSNL